jgi:tRNA nucleotidyltransferase/poly(A) polymerase
MASPTKLKQIVNKISKIAFANGIHNSFIVGGYPRAIIMDRVKDDTHDLDFASAWPGEATKLGSIASGELSKELPEIYHRTGTIVFNYEGIDLEFQGGLGSISDTYDIARELEKFGIAVSPLTLNIYERDFYINTLILDLNDQKIYDITGYGVSDIKNKRIRTVIDPTISAKHNPLMLLRAIRFAFRYDFVIEDRLKELIKNSGRFLRKRMSSERLQIEVLKMLQANYEETMIAFEKYNLGDLLKNSDYDIMKIIKDIDIENFSGELDQLIKESPSDV